jgi:hypothetical protein
VSDTNGDGLTIDYKRDGRKVRVTVRFGGEPVFLDIFDPAAASRRSAFAKALLEKVPAADPVAIEAELLRFAAAEPADAAPAGEGAVEAIDELAAMPADIRQEAEAMLNDVELVRQVVDDIEALNVAGERELTTTVYVIGVSRLLPRPLAGCIQGPTSSGKSFVIEQTAMLFPAETVIHATQMTPQCLFHMRPGTLSHKFVVGGERSRIEDDEHAEATRALREMLSSGKLTKLMPMKVEGNLIETVLIEQEGPIAFIESTSLAKIFEEDANRCLLMHTDERAAQTRLVVRRLGETYCGAGGAADPERVVLRHHALQRMLKPYPVVVPFAGQLARLFPCDRVEARRAYPHLIGMVQAVALLHQRQRLIDADGRLVAQPADYHLARYLLAKPLARLLRDGISEAAHRFYDLLAAEWPTETFKTTDAKKLALTSKSAVNGWLVSLHDAGALELVEESRGRKPATWKLTATPPAEGAGLALPTVEELFGGESAWTHGHNAEVPT